MCVVTLTYKSRESEFSFFFFPIAGGSAKYFYIAQVRSMRMRARTVFQRRRQEKKSKTRLQ